MAFLMLTENPRIKTNKQLKIPGMNEALIDASHELLFQPFIAYPFSIVVREVSVIER